MSIYIIINVYKKIDVRYVAGSQCRVRVVIARVRTAGQEILKDAVGLVQK